MSKEHQWIVVSWYQAGNELHASAIYCPFCRITEVWDGIRGEFVVQPPKGKTGTK